MISFSKIPNKKKQLLFLFRGGEGGARVTNFFY